MRTERSGAEGFHAYGASMHVRSRPSGPWIAASTSAASSTLRVIGPSLSIVHESAIAPVRGTRPNVGRSPVTPHRVDGDEIEPRVSEPMAKATSPAATAEPGPADEPLEPWSVFH